MGGEDEGRSGIAGVCRCGGGSLRVEVDDEGLDAGALDGDGKVDGERGLAGAAFLGDEGGGTHAGMVSCWSAGKEAHLTRIVCGERDPRSTMRKWCAKSRLHVGDGASREAGAIGNDGLRPSCGGTRRRARLLEFG